MTSEPIKYPMPFRLLLSGIGAAVLLAATVLTGLYLGDQTQSRFRSIDDSWRNYSAEADRRGELLVRIKGLLGYGGIIHNFKNFVLRKEEVYLTRVRTQFDDFKATITEYRDSEASREELDALNVIEKTMGRYEAKIPIAVKARTENWPPSRTDAAVKVDDVGALAALGALDAYWRDKRRESTASIADAVTEGNTLLDTGFRFLVGLAVVALLIYGLFYLLQAELRQTIGLLRSELNERKAAEHVAKKFQRAVEQSPATIIITGTDGLIEYVNAKFCETTGYKPDEVLGRTPKFLQSGDTPPDAYLNLSRQIAQGQEWRGLFRNRKKSGEFYWAQTMILPLRDEDRQITHYIGIGEDITERKRAREQIQKAQKMEAVGLLSSGLAHDFNNVLTTIIGNAHLAKLETPPGHHLREDLEQIEIAAKRASNLVAQVLSFARRQPGDPTPVRISDAVEEVVRLMRASIQSNVRLEFSTDDRALSVFADPTQLHQIILNLCSNAAEAIGGEAGTIKLRTSRLASANGSRAMVRLIVADDGPGIPVAHREKVFDPFFSTKSPGRGTGLGLSVVANLVAEMGGRISISDTSQQGTQFEILLPESTMAPKVLVRSEDAVGGKDRILLVDDQVEVASVCQRLLKRLGYDVEAFTNPLEAVAAFEAEPSRYDLVMTDFVMPEMNGEQVCRAIRTQRADCPILICTAYQPATLDVDTLAPLRIIDKPVDPVKLARVVRSALDSTAAPD